MSRSPRKLLREADRALQGVLQSADQYPDVRETLARTLGANGLAALRDAAVVVSRAAAATSQLASPGADDSQPPATPSAS